MLEKSEKKYLAEVIRADLIASAVEFRCTGVAKNTNEEVVGRYENKRYIFFWKLSLEGECRKFRPSSKEAMLLAKDCTERVQKALSAGKFQIKKVNNKLFVCFGSLFKFTYPLTIKEEEPRPLQLDLVEVPVRNKDAEIRVVQLAFNW